jgi:hypothetical protein
MSATDVEKPERRVCVWFGEHKIVEHLSESGDAGQFEAAMRRRFASLRVTSEPVVVSDADCAPRPSLVDRAVGAPGQSVPAVAGRGAVNDYTRPLLLGYVLKHLLMGDDELAETKERLEEFAVVECFAMGTVYVEDTATSPAAFGALIEAVNRYEVTAVVVPSLLHFAALSAVHNIKDTFERATGARVMVASSSP